MRMNSSTQWILALLLFFTSNFVTQAQTLDATFSSPLTNQCAGSLFTLNATTTTYQGYSWTIDGPNNFTNTSTGTTSALYLTEPGTYNVSLSVTDGVTTETNTVSGFLNVATPATVNAGVDQTVCANTLVMLNGTVGGSATLITWSGGTGTFSPTNANLSAIYSPSLSEIANGFVNLTITTNDPAGPCFAVSDTIMISFSSPPIANAGVDQTICANAAVALNATVSGSATSMSWSGGTGTFSSNIGLMSTYSPSPSEIANGFVNLVITTNDPAGPCSAVSDTIMISFSSPPTTNAGVDQTICANSFATLNGSFGGTASSVTWVYLSVLGGTPGNFSNLLILNPTYTPSASDIANGFVNLILRTNDTAGPCSAVSDTVMIIINQVPTVTAPASICNGSTGQLSPSIGGTWVSNNTSQAAVTNSGIVVGVASGNVTFTFADTLTGCSNTTSIVIINSLPVVNVPSSICVGSTGQLSPATGGTWVSNNSSIATVSGINGLVTGLSPGIVSFIFTSATTGCSTTSSNLTVTIDGPSGTIAVNNTNLTGCSCFNASITVTTSGATEARILCMDGQFLVLTPNTTQTVNYSYCNLGSTSVTRTPTLYISNGTCETYIQSSQTISINPIPTIILSSSSVCVNSTVQLTPSTGGTWVSNNSSIATVSGSGLVTGLSPGIVSFTFTNTITGCSNTSSSLTVTSNATVNSIPNQVVCAGSLTTPITFSGSGQQYNWTNNNSFIGLTTSGTGNIAAFTAINNALYIQVATITVTPISGSCNSTPTTFTITVKPIPTVFTPPNQTLCHNDSTFDINFFGEINGTDYNWTNSNSSIWYVNSGTGNIPSFQVQNLTSVSQIANFIVTPILNGCNGYTDTLSITVNPFSTVNPIPDQIACSGELISSITFSGSHPNTTYNWVQDNTSIGAASFGAGNIPSFQAQNPSSGSQIANFIVTPFLDGCTGISDTFLITVNPLPLINAGNDTLLCAGQSFTPIANGTATSYYWVNYTNGVSFVPPSTIMLTLNGDLNGCIASDNVLLTVVSNPIASITTFDGEDSLACDGTLSVLVTDGTAPYSYTWTNGASNYTT